MSLKKAMKAKKKKLNIAGANEDWLFSAGVNLSIFETQFKLIATI